MPHPKHYVDLAERAKTGEEKNYRNKVKWLLVIFLGSLVLAFSLSGIWPFWYTLLLLTTLAGLLIIRTVRQKRWERANWYWVEVSCPNCSKRYAAIAHKGKRMSENSFRCVQCEVAFRAE